MKFEDMSFEQKLDTIAKKMAEISEKKFLTDSDLYLFSIYLPWLISECREQKELINKIELSLCINIGNDNDN